MGVFSLNMFFFWWLKSKTKVKVYFYLFKSMLLALANLPFPTKIRFVWALALPISVVAYLASGPFLAFVYWGYFCLLAKSTTKFWLMAFKGWSYVLVGVVLKLTLLQSKNGAAFTTMMSACLLSLVLGGLCQLVHFFRYWNFTHTL